MGNQKKILPRFESNVMARMKDFKGLLTLDKHKGHSSLGPFLVTRGLYRSYRFLGIINPE